MPMLLAMTSRMRRCSLIIVVSVVHPALSFCFVFVLSFDVIYFSDSSSFILSQYWAGHHDPSVLQGFELVQVLFFLTRHHPGPLLQRVWDSGLS
jgi:hypothetical protein